MHNAELTGHEESRGRHPRERSRVKIVTIHRPRCCRGGGGGDSTGRVTHLGFYVGRTIIAISGLKYLAN